MLGSSASPAFPIDVRSGLGIDVSRQGTSTVLTLNESPLASSGSGAVFVVATPTGETKLADGLVLCVRADRDFASSPALKIDRNPPQPWCDVAGQPLTRVVKERIYRVVYDGEFGQFRCIALDTVRNADMAPSPAGTLKGNAGAQTDAPADLSTSDVRSLIQVDRVDNSSDADKALPGNPIGDAIAGSAAAVAQALAGLATKAALANEALLRGNADAGEAQARQAAVADLLARLARINAGLYPAERPGDNPTAFTASAAGGDLDALVPLNPATYPIRTVADGLGVEISASREVWERTLHAAENTRLWRGRWRYVRSQAAQDPENDSVVALIQWYAPDRSPVGGPVQCEAFTPSVGAPHEFSAFIGIQGVTGVTIARPNGAVYFRLGLKSFGVESRTVLTDLSAYDVSAVEDAILRLVPPDAVPALSARIDLLTGALFAEAQTRQQDDQIISQAVLNEAQVRDQADATISEAIFAETAARKALNVVYGLTGKGYDLAITDDAGFAIFVQRSGEEPAQSRRGPGRSYARTLQDDDGYGLVVERVDGGDQTRGRLSPPLATSQLVHVLNYGQSLSRGLLAGTSLTPGVLTNVLRFVGGDRADDGAGTSAQNHGSLVPYATTLNGNSEGETPAAGFARAVLQSLQAEGAPLTERDQYLLMSSPGQSGAAIAGLAPGQVPYTRLQDDVSHGYVHAQARGWSYSVPFVMWEQGETDYVAGTTQANYATMQKQMQVDITNTVKAVSGQTENVRMVTYQVGTHAWYGTPPTIALAQLQLATSADPDIIMSTPMYVMEYQPDVHLTSAGYNRLGAYQAKAALASRSGSKFMPVYPIEMRRQGRILLVRMHVPCAPLVLDRTKVSDPNGAYGFELWNPDASAAVAISRVEVYNQEWVKIIAAADITNNIRLRYAYSPPPGYVAGSTPPSQGPRGCLRDSDPSVYDPDGWNMRLHNYCVIFDKGVG